MKVSLFMTCLGEMFAPNVGQAVVELLERLGCEIDFPLEQTCCGQVAYNSGYRNDAIKGAKQTIKAFEEATYVVTISGSCASMIDAYVSLLKDDAYWLNKAKALRNKTFEFTQFLVEKLKITDVGAEFSGKATYHSSCHMARLLGVTDPPKQLLKNVAGLDLLPLLNDHDCCGFGGMFSVKMSLISGQMVDEKVRLIEESGAEVVIGADISCLMNIKGRIERLQKPIKVLHIAEVLNESYKRRHKEGKAYVH